MYGHHYTLHPTPGILSSNPIVVRKKNTWNIFNKSTQFLFFLDNIFKISTDINTDFLILKFIYSFFMNVLAERALTLHFWQG